LPDRQGAKKKGNESPTTSKLGVDETEKPHHNVRLTSTETLRDTKEGAEADFAAL
jgi:hypothetical protein